MQVHVSAAVPWSVPLSQATSSPWCHIRPRRPIVRLTPGSCASSAILACHPCKQPSSLRMPITTRPNCMHAKAPTLLHSWHAHQHGPLSPMSHATRGHRPRGQVLSPARIAPSPAPTSHVLVSRVRALEARVTPSLRAMQVALLCRSAARHASRAGALRALRRPIGTRLAAVA